MVPMEDAANPEPAGEEILRFPMKGGGFVEMPKSNIQIDDSGGTRITGEVTLVEDDQGMKEIEIFLPPRPPKE